MTRYIVPPWMQVVQQEYNKDTAEVPGNEDNPNIVKYHQACTLKATDDETPWCSAFANYCMQQCGLGYKGTRSAQAISWLSWGKSIGGRYGAVSVRDNGDGTGHVCFFLCLDDADPDYGLFVGGNQNNRVQISRYALDSFADFRWPNSFADQGGYG